MMKQRFRRFAEEPLSAGTFLLWLCLLPFSLLYGALQRLRVLLYRFGLFPSYRAPIPVISVGNLTAGGTGKTPVVDLLVRHLLQQGERPAVVSRGYGGQIRSGVAIVSYGDGSGPRLQAAECGDEPFLLARRNPQAMVVVAPCRREGIKTAIREGAATLIILDDGFQHLAVQRDLDILLLDARRPLGNGSLLPAGLLREAPSAHRRAHLCILTRDETLAAPAPFVTPVTLRCRHRLAEKLVALDGSVQSRADLHGRRGVAFAGIANPDHFFEALRSYGLELVATIALNDHTDFTPAMLKILEQAAVGADFFVTTEKDGVKLSPSDLSLPCFQAPLDLEFSPQGQLEEIIDSLLNKEKMP
ncbi:MAG: tetraacyldisaccharide 4'-kinase [Desulfuromonadales bacterium]|nr:tetraacyldisaccharide 4'-kinase [Desulfuromonadales bacterium]